MCLKLQIRNASASISKKYTFATLYQCRGYFLYLCVMGKLFWMAMALYLLYRYVTKPVYIAPPPAPKPPPQQTPPQRTKADYTDYEEIKE